MPCSVNANGRYLIPPLLFEVLKLHLKVSHSVLDTSNMKSGGNLFMFDRTALLRYFVSVSYSSARSKSSITFSPLTSKIWFEFFEVDIMDAYL